MEWKEGNLAAARELFQRAVSVDSKTMDAVRAFQAWGILEEREENIGLARVLFKCALRVDSQNVPTWMSWAAMEERQGNAVRADELRNLCFQQVT
jgi:Tfp pilus assembly protein PilF